MANVSRAIDIIFNGKDFVSAPVTKITKTIGKMVTVVENVADPIAEVVDGILKMEVAVAALSAAVGTLALKAFKDYQYALIDLEKVLREEDRPALEAFKREFEDVAVVYGQSVVDIVKNTTDFVRAGFNLKDSFQLVNRALELSSAGLVDMEIATTNLIAIMKGFEFEASDATHVIDAVNVISDRYATTATELSDSLARVAPAAKLAGLSIDETIGILTPAIEVFRSSEEAGTAWRRGLVKILDDAKPVQEALRQLGVRQKDSNGELRLGKDILVDLAAALKTTTTSQQLFSLSQIFGNRQVAKVITSLRDWDYVTKIVDDTQVDHSYTMEQVQKRWNSFQIQLGAAKSAIEIAAAALGERLSPAAAKVLKAVTDLFSAFDDSLREGAFDTLFNLLEDFGDRLAKYLLDVGQELPKALRDIDYSDLIKAFEGLFTNVGEIIDRFNLDTPEGLRAFLQETEEIIAGVINATTGLVDVFGNFSTKLYTIIKGFKELNPQQQRFIGQVGGWAKLIDEFGVKGLAALEGMSRGASNFEEIMIRVSGLIRHLAGVFELAFSVGSTGVDYIYSSLVSVTQLLHGDVNKAWETFTSVGDRATAHFSRGFKNLTTGLDDLNKQFNKSSSVFDKFGKAGEDTVNEIIKSLKDLSVETSDDLDDFNLSFVDAFGNIAQQTKTNVDSMAEYWKEDLALMRETTEKEMGSLLESLDVTDEIRELNKDAYAEFDALLDEWDKRGGRAFYVDSKRKKAWDEYKKSLVGVAEETTSRVKQEELDLEEFQKRRDADRLKSVESTGKKITKFYGKFTNESLELFKGIIPGLDEYDQRMSDALKQEDTELDVPDDKKFKAAQDKLLKEIDTNADIMQTKIEAFADITESKSKVITSAFETINASVSSTGDVLTSLFSELSSGRLDLMTQSKIQRQISEEEQRRQEAFDLQKQLTQAQIDLIKQRSSAMASGDPMITVSGDGLQPHLEAFMWEILSAIQVRVNEDYGAFLLGIGAT